MIILAGHRSMLTINLRQQLLAHIADSFWPNCTGVGNTTELQPTQGDWTTILGRSRDILSI
jgi:hypothetical protein